MAWDQVRSSYDRVAAAYEERFLDELAEKPRDRELLDAFAASVDGPVVDIGCGPGHIGGYVRCQGRWVVGADISPAMAKRAAVRLDGGLVADMRSLPLADSSVAGLLAFYSLIHARRSEVAAVLRQFERVLTSGGAALLSAHEGNGEIEVHHFLGQDVPLVAALFQLDELVAACRRSTVWVVLAWTSMARGWPGLARRGGAATQVDRRGDWQLSRGRYTASPWATGTIGIGGFGTG